MAMAVSDASFLRPLSRPFTITSLRALKDCMVLNKRSVPLFPATLLDPSTLSKLWKYTKPLASYDQVQQNQSLTLNNMDKVTQDQLKCGIQ